MSLGWKKKPHGTMPEAPQELETAVNSHLSCLAHSAQERTYAIPQHARCGRRSQQPLSLRGLDRIGARRPAAQRHVFGVTGHNPNADIALKLERIALRDDDFTSRKSYPNVDFYSGLI